MFETCTGFSSMRRSNIGGRVSLININKSNCVVSTRQLTPFWVVIPELRATSTTSRYKGKTLSTCGNEKPFQF